LCEERKTRTSLDMQDINGYYLLTAWTLGAQ
jgi:hypothetical protein